MTRILVEIGCEAGSDICHRCKQANCYVYNDGPAGTCSQFHVKLDMGGDVAHRCPECKAAEAEAAKAKRNSGLEELVKAAFLSIIAGGCRQRVVMESYLKLRKYLAEQAGEELL